MASAEIEQGADVSVLPKSNKRAVKALKGTGVKKVDGINRVVLRKRGGVSFVIEQPEVFRTPNGSYIVLGEARVQSQDVAKQLAQLTGQQNGAEDSAAAEAASQATGVNKSPEAITADLEAAAANKKNEPVSEVPDEEVDTTGLDGDKLDMIMQQANCNKNQAAKALRDHDGDLVNALMALTT